MNLKQKIVPIFGAITLATLSLTGCLEENKGPVMGIKLKEIIKSEEAQKLKMVNYFAEIPLSIQSSLAITAGDFNKDGNLDLIVGARISENLSFKDKGALYFFEGDGKGNFKLRQYPANK